MPRRHSAHAQLDQLRQQATAERINARDFEACVGGGKGRRWGRAGSVTDAYAANDEKWAQQRRVQLEDAEAKMVDLGHRVAAAAQRAARGQRAVDTFTHEHAPVTFFGSVSSQPARWRAT